MLTWLGAACLAVGMTATTTTAPLSGTVVDAEGRPAAGVSVWLSSTGPTSQGPTGAINQGPKALTTAETDDEGRFQIERPDDSKVEGGSWHSALWAYRPGSRLARLVLKWRLPEADEPVRLTLGPPASISVRVLRPDGSPAVGARVCPARLNHLVFNAPRPPDKLLDRLTATADADGRATLDGFISDELYSIDVTMGDDLVQCLVPSPGSNTVALRPLGRLSVRLVSDDPEAPLKGWRITATSRPADDNYHGPSTHWRRETTGDDGRIDFAPMAEGQILWAIEPPEGSDRVVAEQPTTAIQAGETTEAVIQVHRGARVEGVVRLENRDKPIPGVGIDVFQMVRNHSGTHHKAVTNDQGRFSIVVPPGTYRFRYNTLTGVPPNYFLPPNVRNEIDFEIKGGEERHELNPPPLREARQLAGLVLNERGEPEPGASVIGEWTSADYAGKTTTKLLSSDPRGEFVFGNIAPGAEARVSASLFHGITHDSETVVVDRVGVGGSITVQLRRKPARAVSGLVLDADGHPLAGASIRVMVLPDKQPAQAGRGNHLRFEGDEAIQTDADGRYETPSQIPADLGFRIEATAPGWEPASTKWLAAADLEAPELRLRKSIGVRELTGRVVDSFGNPVAGAEVFQSLDAPSWERGQTDAGGWFTLDNVPDAPALVFASKEGWRFLGRRVEPVERSVEIVLRSFAEPPSAPLRPIPSPISREEERTIARELIARVHEKFGDARNLPAARPIGEIEAWVDPDRALAMIENQARRSEPAVLEAAAISRSEGDPRSILQLLDAIDEPATAARVALGVFDRVGSGARPDFRRELLERAERSAREIPDPAQVVSLLSQIGDRRLDLGDTEQGAKIVREAHKLLEDVDPGSFMAYLDALISAMARVDLPETMKLLENRDGKQLDQDPPRVQIAKRIAPTHLDEARRLLDSLREQGRLAGRRAVRLRLAKTNLEAARALGPEGEDPLTDALLPAIAAKAQADTDPAAARELLRESVDRLSALESFRLSEPPPAVMLARLLPLAARVDPDRAHGYLWLALAMRPTAPGFNPYYYKPTTSPPSRPLQFHLVQAELAALTARYDRAAAEVVFAPVAARFVDLIEREGWGWGGEGVAALAAAAIFDAKAAKALVEALPDDPPPPNPAMPNFHRRDKLQATVAAALSLGLPPGLRFREPFFPHQAVNDWVAAIED